MKSFHKVVCGSVGGSLLLAYGGSAVVVSRFAEVDTGLTWWGQLLAVLAAGIGCLVWGVRSALSTTKDEKDANEEVDHDIFGPLSSVNCKTAKAVHILAKRMLDANDSEGLQLCRKLHDSLFVMEYSSDESA
jgi:hypothetical protein